MRARRIIIALLAVCALAAQASSASASQTPKAAWKITSVSLPTNFDPASVGRIFLVANNLGAKATEGPITITDEVPPGLEIVAPPGGAVPDAIGRINEFGAAAPSCEVVDQTVTCETAEPIRPGYQIEVRIFVKAPLSPLNETNEATVSGGNAADATTTSTIVVDSSPASFGFLSDTVGLDGPFTDPDGAAATQAGAHPYQLTLDVGFPTKRAGIALVGAGTLRDATVDLPRGVIANPAATTELCTEADLVSDPFPGCPPESQVGTVAITTVAILEEAGVTALYNMVPPPGEAAVLGFNALGIGVFVHILGEVRSDGDYGLSGGVTEALALPGHPVFGSRVSLWGDPSDEVHEAMRGPCMATTHQPSEKEEEECKVPDTDIAFLTLPGECPEEPLHFEAFASSWEEPETFATASYEGADLAGNPSQISGCEGLDFEPALKIRPTTNLADSPSGLDVELIQPQDLSLEGESPSPLRDARVTLPPGMVANASQANGLAACSAEQIGMLTEVGESPVHLSQEPDECPEAAKLGTVEVETPLLAQISDENKVVVDPNGDPVPRPVQGSLYLAKPFDNPFGSLLAIYIVIDDARSGVIAKLAGRVEPDPITGQLSTSFSENPQLPLQAVRLHLFTGSRAPLQTPPTCGTHTTAATLTPWASPDIPDLQVEDPFAITAAPGGGACPPSEAGAPNSPAFSAGTLAPVAGVFSPTLLSLSREDASQRISKLEATLPTGLSAKLAGVGQCSETQIAAAQARSAPEEGVLERAAPSCPASSQVGIVDVGAGAGPTPLHIQGRAYLAGPYKGAPLSAVVITPAIAGPFDLGVVVVRTALYVDPTSAQVRAVSDPFPQILQGIPTDVRSVAVHVDRPQFSLNPTSCDPKSFLGTATSALGQLAPLSSRFQVGGCDALGFKPGLALRLFGGTTRGAHPRFRAVLRARPGDANIARTSVALPHSEFIDQAHFRTICTRVQFAANQCPAGSIYGHVTAFTPLLDYPLEGPIYLRSSSNKLPDVVAALRGPPSQPIAFDLVGRVDSVHGGIRTTFETIPDAPVSRAVVSLQGATKGLFQNSTNICRGIHRATVKMDAQNGKVYDIRPALKASCGGKGKKGRRQSQRR